MLYPEPLPDPDTLLDDLFSSPPPFGTLWTWRDGSSVVQLHDSGALRLERSSANVLACQLSVAATERWCALVCGLDLDAIDGAADDPEHTSSLSRETPEEEASLYYDRRRLPAEVVSALGWLEEIVCLVSAWRPNAPHPSTFGSIC